MLPVCRILLFQLLLLSFVHAQQKKKILSLGGNGMIGTETLRRLIGTGEYEITLASRGSWPFDTSSLIKPYVKWVECDRDDDDVEESCPDLLADIKDTKLYHAILDFSAYDPEWVKEAVEMLEDDKVRVYIYVSTDSVYEVSKHPTQPLVLPDGSIRKTVETEAVRPDDPDLRQELNEKDDYGDDKLAGEEVLIAQRSVKKDGSKGGFPFVSLRFADVVGPRDQTLRFVFYFVWIKYHHIIPIHVPDDILEFSSVTHVGDAAWSIIKVMEHAESWDEAYNIASEEIFNVTAAIETMATLMHVTGVHPEKVEEDSFTMYPSIARGPVDVSKAMNRLGFVPTPIETMLQKTIDWYEELWTTNEQERIKFIEEWADTMFEDDDDDERKEVLERILGVNANERSDEL